MLLAFFKTLVNDCEDLERHGWVVLNILLACLFVLKLNVPVKNFSVMSGHSQRFLGLNSMVGS